MKVDKPSTPESEGKKPISRSVKAIIIAFVIIAVGTVFLLASPPAASKASNIISVAMSSTDDAAVWKQKYEAEASARKKEKAAHKATKKKSAKRLSKWKKNYQGRKKAEKAHRKDHRKVKEWVRLP